MSIMSDWIDTMEDYGFDDLDRTTLARLIDDAHKELCLREPWPFLETQLSFTQAANSNAINPSGFATNALGKVLAFVNKTNNTILTPIRSDEQLKTYVTDLDVLGNPTNYYFVGDDLYIWPTPSSSIELRIRYLTEPTTLIEDSADSEILWPFKHDSVVLYAALSKAYFINDDPQGAALQQVMESRLQIARNDLWAKQYDRTDTIQVLDNDYFLF